MIQFDKPQNLNGAELLDELKTVGVTVEGLPLIDEDGNFWLDITETDKVKATPIVDTHNGTTVAPEPTIADKLASVGLSIEELKAALGGN
jgi:hypothetical protein